MRGIFTKDERAVVLFLAVSLLVGALVIGARRVDPALTPNVPPASEAAFASGQTPAPRAAPSRACPVDVNRAGVDELTSLPGIGPARAAAIVRLRRERGRFETLDDLTDVKGIGLKTLERLRPLATLGAGGASDRPEVEPSGEP